MLSIAVGCSNEVGRSTADNSPTMRLSFPYDMDVSEKKAFCDKLQSLRPGQAIDEVRKFLGPPFYQEQIRGKESNAPVTGIRLTYYLKKLGDGVNEKLDQYVNLIFNNDGHLIAIDTNIAGLTFGSLTGINTGTAKMIEVEGRRR
jgi:hypothetical protein